MRTLWLGMVGLGALGLSACKDDGCSDELKIALEVHIAAPVDLIIDRVSVELEREEDCGSFRDRTTDERVWTCYEQGGGEYTVRVFSGDQELHQETKRVEAGACHVEQRETLFITVEAP